MKQSPQVLIGEMVKQCSRSFYQWLGITKGSFSDIAGNHIRVGHVFLEQGNAKEALGRAKLVLLFSQSHADAHVLKAHAHALLGEKDAAEQAYNEAIRLGYADKETLRQTIHDIMAGVQAPASEVSATEAKDSKEDEPKEPDAAVNND